MNKSTHFQLHLKDANKNCIIQVLIDLVEDSKTLFDKISYLDSG